MTMVDGERSTAVELSQLPVYSKAIDVLQEDARIRTLAENGPVAPEQLQQLVTLANELLQEVAETINKNPDKMDVPTTRVMVKVLNVVQLRIASVGARVRIASSAPDSQQRLDTQLRHLTTHKDPVAAAKSSGLDIAEKVAGPESTPDDAEQLVTGYNALINLRDMKNKMEPPSSAEIDNQLKVLVAMQTALLSKGRAFSLELISPDSKAVATKPAAAAPDKQPARQAPAAASAEKATTPEKVGAGIRVKGVEIPYKAQPKMIALLAENGTVVPIRPDQFTGCKYIADPKTPGRGSVEIVPDRLNVFPAQTTFIISESDWQRVESLVPIRLIVEEAKIITLPNDRVQLNEWQFRSQRLVDAESDPRDPNRVVVMAPSLDTQPRPFRIEISKAAWKKITQPVYSEKVPEPPEKMTKAPKVGSWAEQGRRSYMEDRTLVAADVIAQGDSLIGIFDGHGGDAVAQMAQEQMVSVMKQLAQSEKDVKEILRKSILTLNSIIEQNPKLKNVGATAAMIYVRNGVLYSANVGDARSVIDGAGGLAVRVSYDHKADDPAEEARIRRDGGIVTHNQGDVARVNGVLAVARALGDRSMGAAVSAEAHLTETKLGVDNTIAIVACDGIWDVIDDQMAMQIAKTLRSQGKNEQEIARALVQKAFDLNSGDNLSATVVFLN